MSAYVFARAGIPVALFERGAITQGSTCASTALLMQEPDRGFVELVRRYGHVRARRVWRTSRRALRQLTAALERMDCGLRYQDSVHIARDPAAARALTVDYRARRAAGLAGRLLSEAAVTRTTGIHANAGILTKGGAVVDPVRHPFQIACAWDGLFATSPDGLPYIGPHRRYPGHLFALGYGGNGMTFALLAASILMDHYRGRRHRDADLFRFDKFRGKNRVIGDCAIGSHDRRSPDRRSPDSVRSLTLAV